MPNIGRMRPGRQQAADRPLGGMPSVDFADSVAVVVGPSKTTYHLPKTLLCKNSDFFKAALNSTWKESVERQVLLPEVNPHYFNDYAHWVMYEGLPFGCYTCGYEELSDLWLLGDVLVDQTFKCAILRRIAIRSSAGHGHPERAEINRVWASTTEDSELRKTYLRVFSNISPAEALDARDEEYDPAFLRQLCGLLLDLRFHTEPADIPVLEYVARDGIYFPRVNSLF